MFTYQVAVNDAWFNKDDYKVVITTIEKAGIFTSKGGFCKLGHEFLKSSKRQSYMWTLQSQK